MNIGIFTWFGFILNFEDRLRLIKEAGFDHICTWWGDDFSELDGDKRHHKELAERLGLVLEHAHLPYYESNHLWLDNIDGKDLTERYLHLIKQAGEAEIPTLVMHPYYEPEVINRGDFSVFLMRLESLVDQAEKSRVRIALENIGDWSILEKIFNENHSLSLGLCYDSGHAHAHKAHDLSLLESFGERLFALHLHDNHGAYDEHLLPGEGTIQWNQFIKIIRNIEFKGSFMLESMSDGKGNAKTYLDMAISHSKKLLEHRFY